MVNDEKKNQWKSNKQCPETTVSKKYTFVQKYGNQIDEIFDLPPDTEHIFSASYFDEKTIVDVQTIESMLKSTNLHRVQKWK